MGPNTTLILHAMRSTRGIALAIATLEIGILTFARARGWDIGETIVGLGCALFSGSLAADLASGDAAAGRLRTLAQLPVRPFDLWVSRVLYWFGATGVFTLLTVALDAGLTTLFPNAPGLGRNSLHWSLVAPMGLTYALVAGSVAFGMGAIVPHPLGACVLATFVLAGLAWGFVSMANFLKAIDLETSTFGIYLTALTIGTLFLVISALTFLTLRVPAAPRRRTLARGAATLAVLTLVAASAGALTIRSHLYDVDPLPSEISNMEPSPDGKYIALWSQGRASRQIHSSFVHIVNTGTGDVRPVPDRRVSLAHDWTTNGWTPGGKLTLLKAGWSFAEEEQAPTEFVKVEPATGEILGRIPLEMSSFGEFPPSWGTAQSKRNGRADVYGTYPIRDVNVKWTATDKSLTFASRLFYRRSPMAILMTKTPGVFFGCDEAGRLMQFDMSTDERHLAHEGPVKALWLSSDDRFVLVQTEETAEVLDVKALTRVAGPWEAKPLQVSFVRGAENDRFVKISTCSGCTHLVDLRTGKESVLPIATPGDWRLVSIGPDRFVVARKDHSLDVIDTAGNVVRRLIAPPHP